MVDPELYWMESTVTRGDTVLTLVECGTGSKGAKRRGSFVVIGAFNIPSSDDELTSCSATTSKERPRAKVLPWPVR